MKYILYIVLLLTVTLQDKDADLVRGLEGDGSNYTVAYNKEWYSGYLNVNQFGVFKNNYELHYFFFPSQSQSAATDPLILWLNGGPGCSSLMGALTEHGPFVYQDNNENNTNNQYSWNKISNMIYLESPPGVGFSKTDSYAFTDDLSAQVNLAAILAFLDRFPEYKQNKFYITGESYGGIYVPTLAYAVSQYNDKATEKINLVGMMIGNGAIDPYEVPSLCINPDLGGQLLQPYVNTYLHQQGVMNAQIYSDYSIQCSHITPDKIDKCKAVLDNISQLTENCNIYNIDGYCYPQHNNNVKDKKNKSSLKVQSTPPCINAQGSLNFLGNTDVQKQLHIDPLMKYSMCSDEVGENYKSSPLGSYYLVPFLLFKYKLKFWFFSGDADAAVPITGTFKWINDLRLAYDLSDLIPYTPWYSTVGGSKQVQGSYWRMDGLTFVRFKGCGHMVPSDNPQGAFEMLTAFLNDQNMNIAP